MLQQTEPLAVSTRVTERRTEPRGGPNAPSRNGLESMILGTYREMPGLSLTSAQAARLFGITPRTAEVVLGDLNRRGALYTFRDGRYLSSSR